MESAGTSEAQRQRFLDALTASIRERGLVETQVTDIVRIAKASRRTFYNHFPDKFSCYVELIEQLTRNLIEQLDRVTDRTLPVPEQVDQFIDGYLEILLGEPELATAFWLPALDERVVAAQRSGYDRVSAFVVSVIEQERTADRTIMALSPNQAYMLVVGFHQTLMRAHAAGRDLRTVAAELKPLLKSGLTRRSDLSGV